MLLLQYQYAAAAAYPQYQYAAYPQQHQIQHQQHQQQQQQQQPQYQVYQHHQTVQLPAASAIISTAPHPHQTVATLPAHQIQPGTTIYAAHQPAAFHYTLTQPAQHQQQQSAGHSGTFTYHQAVPVVHQAPIAAIGQVNHHQQQQQQQQVVANQVIARVGQGFIKRVSWLIEVAPRSGEVSVANVAGTVFGFG